MIPVNPLSLSNVSRGYSTSGVTITGPPIHSNINVVQTVAPLPVSLNPSAQIFT